MNTRHLRAEHLAGRRWRGLVRESTERQADRWSPERQRDELRRAADELRLVPAEPVFYERVGSGEAVGAAELEQALADAGQYDVLVVTSTSRFARNRAEAVRMKAAFKKAGIVIYFVAERLISGTFAGALSEGLHEVLDEHANEERRFWIAGGLRQRQLAGQWVGVVPFGFRKVLADRDDGTRGWNGALEPDPATAPTVRRIFDLAAQGASPRAIAADLNATADRPWSRNAVTRILANPVYAGQLVRYRDRTARHYYDHDADDGHVDLGPRLTPLVDPTLFEQVGAVRRRRPGGSGRARVYPLSSILRCRRCARKMTGAMGSRSRYYRCSGRAASGSCDAPAIRADVAEAAFADWIGSLELPRDWRAAIARTTARAEAANERNRQANLTGRLARLRELYEWGEIDRASYQEKAAAIRADMAELVRPDFGGLEAVAEALANLGPTWLAARPEVRAVVPPLMLKSAEVENGQVVAWVVHASLRPLLELCVAVDRREHSRAPDYTVRFSA